MERSRTGCATCRKRKRKCDETRPACRACTARGVECGGYNLELRWGNAVASRGHLAGATTPVRPPPANSSSSSSIRASSASRRPPLYEHTLSNSPQSSLSSSSPSTSPAGVQYSLSSPEEDFAGLAVGAPVSVAQDEEPQVGPLYERFLQHGLRFLYASGTAESIEDMFRRLAIDSFALTTAGAAMQTYVDEGRSPRALQGIGHALRTLSDELRQRRGALSASTMCACLMVCSLQGIALKTWLKRTADHVHATIKLFEADPWTCNLKLMTDLYDLRGSLVSLQPDPQYDLELRAQLEVLAMMDISFLVIGRTSPSVGLWLRFRAIQDTWEGGRQTGNELVSGLPRSLLDILARSCVQEDAQMEKDLWFWSGEPGHLLSCQHWDSVKYAALLRLRRCRRYTSTVTNMVEPQTVFPGFVLPTSEVILYRLLSCLEAMIIGLEQPEYHDLISMHSTLFAMSEASLMVSTLKQHPDWTRPLKRMRGPRPTGSARASGPPRVVSRLFKLLDEAWESGQDYHDIDKAAQEQGVEIAIF